MADDEKKPTDNPFAAMAEQFKMPDLDFLKGFDTSIAGRAFSMRPQDLLPPRMPTMSERLDFMSADTIIGDLLSRIRHTQVDNPDKGELAVMMQTPDGRILDVEALWPEGFATFRAEGYVNGMKAFVVGHISTLSLFCAFEERKDKARVGFRTDTVPAKPPVTEPQSEPEQTEP